MKQFLVAAALIHKCARLDAVTCTVPGVTGGSTSESGEVGEGSVVTVTCSSPGYSPSPSTITCTSSGSFDTTNPTCNKGSCWCCPLTLHFLCYVKHR